MCVKVEAWGLTEPEVCALRKLKGKQQLFQLTDDLRSKASAAPIRVRVRVRVRVRSKASAAPLSLVLVYCVRCKCVQLMAMFTGFPRADH